LSRHAPYMGQDGTSSGQDGTSSHLAPKYTVPTCPTQMAFNRTRILNYRSTISQDPSIKLQLNNYPVDASSKIYSILCLSQ